MVRAVALLAAVAATALVASGPTAARPDVKPSLRVVTFAPLTVRGAGFAPREVVRVEVSWAATGRRRVVAGATGAFAARFEGIRTTHCEAVRVVAVGSRGSRAVLKYLPSPACLPE